MSLLPATSAVVYRPIVVEKANLELGRYRVRTVPVHVVDQGRCTGEKILCVEIEDGRDPDFALDRIDAHIALLRKERAGRRIELLFQGVGRERGARQPRAAHRHAIERKVDALLAERPDDIVLEVVERDRFSADGDFLEVEECEFRDAAETSGNTRVDDAVHR